MMNIYDHYECISRRGKLFFGEIYKKILHENAKYPGHR